MMKKLQIKLVSLIKGQTNLSTQLIKQTLSTGQKRFRFSRIESKFKKYENNKQIIPNFDLFVFGKIVSSANFPRNLAKNAAS